MTAGQRRSAAAHAALVTVVCAFLLIAPPRGRHLLSGAFAALGLALGAAGLALYVLGRQR